MVAKGRLLCIRLAAGELKEALTPHLWGEAVSLMCPYGQLRFRRRPVWAELFRLRDVATDLYMATKGHCLSQKYLEAEVGTVIKELFKKKTFDKQLQDDITELCYRLRAMMAHIRGCKVNGWVPPTRFGILSALINLAHIEPPPKELQQPLSPIADKKVRRREMVWLAAPPPMLSRNVGTAISSASEAEESSSELSVVFVESPPASVDKIVVCSDTDIINYH